MGEILQPLNVGYVSSIGAKPFQIDPGKLNRKGRNVAHQVFGGQVVKNYTVGAKPRNISRAFLKSERFGANAIEGGSLFQCPTTLQV
jgi:hypothetical protein